MGAVKDDSPLRQQTQQTTGTLSGVLDRAGQRPGIGRDQGERLRARVMPV